MGAHDNIAVQSSWLNGQMLLAPGELYGQEYFVDGLNGNSGNDGLSWATALDTIANGVTAVDTYRAITGNANKRCRLYIGGGGYTETVTALPNSCDIIGCGTSAGYPTYCSGAWTIATRNTGCRIYNLRFTHNTSTAVFSLTDNSWYGGLYNCIFYAGGANNYAVSLTGSCYYTIDNCQFIGNVPYTRAIYLTGTTGWHNSYITNCMIAANTTGIYITNNLNCSQSVIQYNIFTAMAGSGGGQLDEGIYTLTSFGPMIIKNWISAAAAIVDAGGSIANYTIDNWIVEAETGATETAATDFD